MKRNKKDYPTSEETREVLNGHEAGIAKQYGCTAGYIFNIKNMEEPDPYPPFRKWFSDCAFGGGKVSAYLYDLSAVAYQAENGVCKSKDIVCNLLTKIDTDARETHIITESISDGSLDEEECKKILGACDQRDIVTKQLREIALNRLNQIKEKKVIAISYGFQANGRQA